MRRVVAAMDPGLVTGVCLVVFESDRAQVLDSRELEFGQLLGWTQDVFPTAEYLVAERFVINQNTVRNTQAPWSLMAIGVFTAVAMELGKSLELQSPSDAKSLFSNDRLRRVGMWHRGGAGHANDSLRHAGTFAVKRLNWRIPELVAINTKDDV